MHTCVHVCIRLPAELVSDSGGTATPPEQNITTGAAQIEAHVFRGELTDSLGDNVFLLLTFGHTKQ